MQWRPTALIAVVALLLAGVAGCSTSPWEREFVATGPVAASPASAPVRVREVDWDRLQAGLEGMRREAAASDVPEAEWPPERRAAHKADLLRTLQVTSDPAEVEVVGRSEFRTTRAVRPDRDGELAALARKVGATEVVWSRRHLGKAETIIQEPVTSYSSGTGWGSRRRHHVYSESTTTWVPVVVAADEFAYVAYLLRR